MRIQVKDFMSAPVYTVTEKATVGEVRAIMKSKYIHALPIVEYVKELPEARVIIKGIVTATDLNVKAKDKAMIKDFMTQNIHIIHKDSSVQVAAKMMLKHKVHHLVSMEEGLIIGMVSSLDFVKIVADLDLAH
jgi:acetoin utilization protein AcuB